MEHGFDHLDAPVDRVAGLDVPIPCGPVLSDVYPSADAVAAAIEQTGDGKVGESMNLELRQLSMGMETGKILAGWSRTATT